MKNRNAWWTKLVVLAVLLTVYGAMACGSDDTSNRNHNQANGNQSSGEEELVGEDSPVVGGGCFENDACEEICMTGDDWPGGMCTVECEDDRDCPDLSYCVAIERGICLMDCIEDDDCPSGYECDDIDREGHRGEVYVCVKD